MPLDIYFIHSRSFFTSIIYILIQNRKVHYSKIQSGKFQSLIYEIKSQLNFSSVDSHLSMASQNFVNGRISEGLSELKSANEEWKNSSMTIIRIGSDFISLAKNDTTSTNDSTKEILDNFGNILVNIGKKIENLRIQLSD